MNILAEKFTKWVISDTCKKRKCRAIVKLCNVSNFYMVTMLFGRKGPFMNDVHKKIIEFYTSKAILTNLLLVSRWRKIIIQSPVSINLYFIFLGLKIKDLPPKENLSKHLKLLTEISKPPYPGAPALVSVSFHPRHSSKNVRWF